MGPKLPSVTLCDLAALTNRCAELNGVVRPGVGVRRANYFRFQGPMDAAVQ